MRRLPRLAPLARAFALFAALSCTDATGPGTEGQLTPLRVYANLSATAIKALVVQVTGPGITTPLVFNLLASGTTVSSTIAVPAGSERRVVVRAYDAGGVETHYGEHTLDILGGTNPTLSLTLVPHAAGVPVTISLGSVVVGISGTLTTTVGATSQLSAIVWDAYGNVVNTPVTWASLAPTRASVDSTGAVFARDSGQVDIVATALGAAGRVTMTFLSLGTDATHWMGGAFGAPTSWQVAANWWPRRVPGIGDSVRVYLRQHQPVLVASVTTAALVIDSGATVSTGAGFALEVTRTLTALGAVTGSGSVYTGGDGVALRGTLDVSQVTVQSTTTLTGATTVTGSLTTNASLHLEGYRLDVGGNVEVTGQNAAVVMDSVADTLSVDGYVAYDANDQSSYLTDGTMILRGSLYNTGGYAAGRAHTTRFTGGGCGVTISDEGTTTFGVLRVDSGTTVNTIADVEVASLHAPGGLLGGYRVIVTDSLAEVEGYVGGILRITGTARAVGATTVTDTLVIDGGRLELDSGVTMTVNGSLRNTSGILRMQKPAELGVGGSLLWNTPTSHFGELTAGRLTMGGHLVWLGGFPFRASGTHALRVAGGGSHIIDNGGTTMVGILEVPATDTVGLKGQMYGRGFDVDGSVRDDSLATVIPDGSGAYFRGKLPFVQVASPGVYVSGRAIIEQLEMSGATTTLDLNGERLTVNGRVELFTGSGLVMQNAADTLDVAGNLIFNTSVDYDTLLTNGVIRFAGDTLFLGTSGVKAAAGHTISMIQAGGYQIIRNISVDSAAYIGNLRIEGSSNVTIYRTVVQGSMRVLWPVTVTSSGFYDVRGVLRAVAGSYLTGDDIGVGHASGTDSIAGDLDPYYMTFSGTGQALRPRAENWSYTYIWQGASVTVLDTLVSAYSVEIDSGSTLTVPAANTLTLDQLSLYSSATLNNFGTTNVSGSCFVSGSATINGTVPAGCGAGPQVVAASAPAGSDTRPTSAPSAAARRPHRATRR